MTTGLQPSLSARTKAARCLGGLALLALSLEAVMRLDPGLFADLTHRVRLKAAMVEARRTTDLLFAGTSRFKDGVSPDAVMAAWPLQADAPKAAFNAAITGANLNRLSYLMHRVRGVPGLRWVVLELSSAQLVPGALGFGDAADDTPGFEARLQRSASEYSVAIRYRRALRPQMLLRGLAVLGADRFEGSEWFRHGWLIEAVSAPPPISKTAIAAFRPALVLPSSQPLATAESTPFPRVAQALLSTGLKVILVSPPLTGAAQRRECSGAGRAALLAAAAASGAPLLDYACSPLPKQFFRDWESHLNRAVRLLFSAALSRDLAALMPPRGSDAL